MTSTDLLHAILAAPEDDLPRLIASDWFEENGASELAEFIRRQIANPDSRIDNCMGDGATGLHCPYDGGKLCPHCDDLQKESGFPASLFGEGKVFFRRGFPDEIHTTLREWVGLNECRSCGSLSRELGVTAMDICVFCHGTGRIPGIAGRVCGQWPVTKVVLTDREPMDGDNGHTTWHLVRNDETSYFDFELPPSIFHKLRGPKKLNRFSKSIGLIEYPSRKRADIALSAAAIRYGRRLAGLPELES